MQHIKVDLVAGVPQTFDNVYEFQNTLGKDKVYFTINGTLDYDTAFYCCPTEKETGLGGDTFVFQSKVDTTIVIGVD